MIDIIIPVFNSQKTIIETLSSVAIQTIKNKVNVYIIDDCSNNNYEKELEIFKDKLNITYIRMKKNIGPGATRQIGIDKSKGKYILFLDSDDQLFNCYSLEILYNCIEKNKLDIVMGYYYIEENDKIFLANESHINGCLHGKMYRRKHLKNNNIKFNNSRYSEDNSFNTLALVTTDKTYLVNNIVYVYKNNIDSLTNNKEMIIKINCSYLYNMLWVINNLEKRKINKDIIINILLNVYTYIFITIKHNENINFKKLYINCSKYEEKYKEYEKYITDDQIYEYIRNKIECDIIMKKIIINEFKKIRKKFKINNR